MLKFLKISKSYTIFGVLVLIIIILLTFSYFRKVDLGYGYTKNKWKVYYRSLKIEKADFLTFKALDSDCRYGNYAKDKNNAYLGDGVLEGVDSKTLVVLGGCYIKDKNDFYNFGEKMDKNIMDEKSFEVIDSDHARDKNNFYLGAHVVEILSGQDNKDIIPIDERYFKDDNFVYFVYRKIEGADPDTFQIIDDNYAKDKNNIYLNGLKMDADTLSFESLGRAFAKDKNYVFMGYDKVEGLDVSTIEILSDIYLRDKNNCYNVNKGKMVNMEECNTINR